MRFELQFKMDNDAFNNDPGTELRAILDGIASKVHNGVASQGSCMDSNGNTVGHWAIIEDEDDPDDAEAEGECRHCGRAIVREDGTWVDPEATGDDSVWREVCDSHDTFTAEHEPVD